MQRSCYKNRCWEIKKNGNFGEEASWLVTKRNVSVDAIAEDVTELVYY